MMRNDETKKRGLITGSPNQKTMVFGTVYGTAEGPPGTAEGPSKNLFYNEETGAHNMLKISHRTDSHDADP